MRRLQKEFAMRSRLLQVTLVAAATLALLMVAQAEDLKITKKISVGESSFTSETYIKGARERNEMNMPGGVSNLSIHQCDLKRTLTVNDQTQTYMVAADPESGDTADAAALLTGAPAAQAGGKVTLTSIITDTGERKALFGYAARRLKTSVIAESSPGSCSNVHQKFEMDGWYADVGKDLAGCAPPPPPIRQAEGCHDRVVVRSKGRTKPGIALAETIRTENPDGQPLTMTFSTDGISKQTLSPDLFDVPAGYRQVNSAAEMIAVPVAQVATAAAPTQTVAGAANAFAGVATVNPGVAAHPYAMMSPAAVAAAMKSGMGGIPGMPGAASAGGAPVAAPQALGPKAPGKIRIGIVAPEAQLGQGNSTGMDYGTPIRNAIIAYMNGPAVEIAALDAHIQMQLQAEAQQKQCDYILYSNVTVKHGGGGGFGKFMKMAGPASSMVPMLGAAKGMGAVTAAGMATSTMAQTAAMSSLANFNGQIKNRDEVTMAYQLTAAGQQSPKLSNTLKAKANSDGQDVLSPLIQEMANTIVTEAARK
ncbi:MAG: hypothetical protein JO249_18360 [Acidobacteria bacterium]|nr:hypothetical protein [Acidobacteriota bacterium]